MLLNLSNHASDKWGVEQAQAAETDFGEIRDVPFPALQPAADLNSIIALAHEYVQKCQTLFQQSHFSGTTSRSAAEITPQRNNQPQRSENPTPAGRPASAIHVMGEMTFVYQFVKRATAAGLRCVASTTERIAVDHPEGRKTSEFRFVRFREYELME